MGGGGEVVVIKKRLVSDEGMRALAEAMAGGRREEGNEWRGEAQRGFVLPKLLRVYLTVPGDGATMPQVTALEDALFWACPRLEELDTIMLTEEMMDAVIDMAEAANARRCVGSKPFQDY